MRKIFLFMHTSLDGYVEGPNQDISWFNANDHHFESFSLEQSKQVDAILFGRKTYELMQSFWPTPQAAAMAPEIARFMNEKPKYVASRRPFELGWQNVTVLPADVAGAVARLKAQPGKAIAIFGSNNLCTSLLPAGLIDELRIVVNPVVLGAGTALFAGLPEKAALSLTDTRPFKSGKILLTYEPGAR